MKLQRLLTPRLLSTVAAAALALPAHGATWKEVKVHDQNPHNSNTNLSLDTYKHERRNVPPRFYTALAYEHFAVDGGNYFFLKATWRPTIKWLPPQLIEKQLNPGGSGPALSMSLGPFGNMVLAHSVGNSLRFVRQVAENNGSGCLPAPLNHWNCTEVANDVAAGGVFLENLRSSGLPLLPLSESLVFNLNTGPINHSLRDKTGWVNQLAVPESQMKAIALTKSGTDVSHVLISSLSPEVGEKTTKWYQRKGNSQWSSPELVRQGYSKNGDIVVGGGGTVHVCTSDNSSVYYSQRSANTWTSTDLGPVMGENFKSCSLTLKDGKPVIAYFDGGGLKVTRQIDALSWTPPETVAAASGVKKGLRPSLALDRKNNKLMVAYTSTEGHVWVATEP